MVTLPKHCWILLKYCKKVDLQPNIYLPYHEPPPSLITSGELEVHEPNSSSPLVITSSRVHEMNGTLFHHSWTRDHEFTSSMECSIRHTDTHNRYLLTLLWLESRMTWSCKNDLIIPFPPFWTFAPQHLAVQMFRSCLLYTSPSPRD